MPLYATGAEASGLRCFSCTDCSVGGALSAQKQQCRPEETFCASVSLKYSRNTVGVMISGTRIR